MAVKLDYLNEGTQFTIPFHNQENLPEHLQGQKFEKGGGFVKGFGPNGQTQCRPLMGEKYQTDKNLLVWIPNNIEVWTT